MSYSYDAGTTTPTYAGLVEFGGIRINDGTFKSERLGGLVDSPPIRGAVSSLASDSGGFAGASFMDPRNIQLDGWIWTPSTPDDVFAAMDQLRGAFALSGAGNLATLVCKQRGWATRRQVSARIAGPIVFNEPAINDKKIPKREFTIPLVAPDPILYDADTLNSVTVPATSTPTSITTAGTVPSYFAARFTGPFTSLSLIRSGGATITVAATITAGHYVDVNTNPVTGLTAVTDLGVNVYDKVTTWTGFQLVVGADTWSATGAGTTGASQVVVSWRDSWV